MQMLSKTASSLGVKVLVVMALTFLFAVAYAQSPLYTSNQNQYFLHGLARAGLGSLEQDWQANTLDPTPVFSALVEYIYRLTRFEAIFYLCYAALLGIYLVSLLGIAASLFASYDEAQKNVFLIVLVSMLVVIHSAALRFFLSRILSENWTYLFEDGVADQRILGPVFQPSAFGVLLVTSIHLFMQKRPYLAILLAVLAATFHPTYLLSAAVLTALYLFLTWTSDRNLGRVLSLALFSLLIVAPILFYALVSFAGTSSDIAAQAREILVSYRIPHHAQVGQWLDSTVAIKAMIILVALYLARRSRMLFSILLGSTLMAVLLTLVQALLGSNLLALLFPWRLSIFIVPLSTSLILAACAAWMIRLARGARGRINGLKILSGAAILLAVLIGAIRFKLDLDRKAADPAQALYTYVNLHQQSGDLYLTPIKLQDFRLESAAPVFVDFKSIPYKDTDVLEWYRRVRRADEYYQRQDCELLKNIIADEKISHVVLETDFEMTVCPDLHLLYQDQSYTLLRSD